MNNYFTYSVLQYKHSLLLGETLNVGILFYFPENQLFQFIQGDGTRAKAIYPDFDNSLYNAYLKIITNKVKSHFDLFNLEANKQEFLNYIHNNILPTDAAGLVFREPVNIQSKFSSIEQIVNEYSGLLLPGINTVKSAVHKHDDKFILKTFTGYLINRNKDIEKQLIRNQVIKTENLKIKFDISWKNDFSYFVKPLSFDLSDENSIQFKAAAYCTYLRELAKYSKANNSQFDFLIAGPQQNNSQRDYLNALDLIDSVKGPSKLIIQENWDNFFNETLSVLSSN